MFVYRDHTIVSSAVYDDISGEWKLNACVSWQGSGDRIQFLKDPLLTFAHSEAAAEMLALSIQRFGLIKSYPHQFYLRVSARCPSLDGITSSDLHAVLLARCDRIYFVHIDNLTSDNLTSLDEAAHRIRFGGEPFSSRILGRK